jgi:hypothetical protein
VSLVAVTLLPIRLDHNEALQRTRSEPVRSRVAAFVLGAFCLFAGIAAVFGQLSQPKFPTLTGRIVDEAGLLSAQDRTELAA